jgi:hypothetical protein
MEPQDPIEASVPSNATLRSKIEGYQIVDVISKLCESRSSLQNVCTYTKYLMRSALCTRAERLFDT